MRPWCSNRTARWSTEAGCLMSSRRGVAAVAAGVSVAATTAVVTTSGSVGLAGSRRRRRRGCAQGPRRVDAGLLQVRLEHEPDELLERHRRSPIECPRRLRGVATQLVDLGRPEVALVDADVLFPVEPCHP